MRFLFKKKMDLLALKMVLIIDILLMQLSIQGNFNIWNFVLNSLNIILL